MAAASITDPLVVNINFPGPDGKLLFAARGAAIRVAGAWSQLRRLAPPKTSSGTDAIGSFEATSAKYTAAGTSIVLSVRRHADAVAFEQRFPQGLDAGVDPAPSSPPQPLVAFPCLSLADASNAAWRSWHGHWGSFTGVGLRPNNSLVFNGVPIPSRSRSPVPSSSPNPSHILTPARTPGVPTMPLLFFPANRSDSGGGVGSGAVMVSPLANFTDVAHAAHGTTWRHGPNGLLGPTAPRRIDEHHHNPGPGPGTTPALPLALAPPQP